MSEGRGAEGKIARVLDVAAFGWDHDGWAATYYPEDLPRDWRLTYYANEFRAVVVPAEGWLAAGPEGCAVWAEEVTERFRFYLELPDSKDWASAAGLLEPCCRALDGKLGGVLSRVDRPRFAADPPDHLPLAWPLPEPLEGCELALGRGVIVARMAPAVMDDLRLLRRVMGHLPGRYPAIGRILLVVAGRPPNMVQMQQAKILAEMLGLA